MDLIASLPGWAITAIVCGILGGMAGLVGRMLQKSGFAWGRFAPIIGIVIGVQLSQLWLVDWVRAQALTPSRVSAMLKSHNPELYGFLETAFPNDYAQLTTRVAEVRKGGGDPAKVSDETAEAMVQFRRKYAPMVARASDEDQRQIIASNLAFYSALLAADTMLCNSVAISGPVALMNRTGYDQLKAMVEPKMLIVFRAVANAMVSPVTRRAATDADYQELGDALFQRGLTDAQFDAVSTSDPDSPDLCPALIITLQTLNSVDTEGVKAVRAEFIRKLEGA